MTLAASFSFLTPRGGMLAVLALVPLAAIYAGARRVERVRRTLRLPAPAGGARRHRELLAAAAVALLALAATQPAVETQSAVRARTDAQAFVVVDTSRSMLAAPSPSGETRLARAKTVALALGARVPDVPLGVATFTDRVLPDLFPTSDRGAYDSVVQSLQAEDPPPEHVNTVATTFDALGALATQGFFPASVAHRAVVLITDGESRPFDPAAVAATLRSHGIRLAVVRVGSGADRVWKPDGTPEANYRPDPVGARLSVERLDAAARVPAGATAASVVAAAAGRGPTKAVGVGPHTLTLAPVPAVLALLALAWLLGGGILRERLRGVTFRAQGTDAGRAT
ncbi:MAG TPA: vWA domain-containing protein [Gaiellaceae bacterium]|nr:vWA domain-containing protein [Gaiellaceae bacterium]